MSSLPAYKPGDYLECGEGEAFSRILVLSENRVLIKSGVAAGTVMSMDEWYFIVGEARASIQNTTYFDSCKGCPYYASDPVCADASIESMGNNSIGSNSNSIGRKSCLRTSSTSSGSSIRSVSIDAQLPTLRTYPDIQKQTTLRRVELPPPKARNWYDWFTHFFLCGLID